MPLDDEQLYDSPGQGSYDDDVPGNPMRRFLRTAGVNSAPALPPGSKVTMDDGSQPKVGVIGTDKGGRPMLGVAPAQPRATEEFRTGEKTNGGPLPQPIVTPPSTGGALAAKPGIGNRLAALPGSPKAPEMSPDYDKVQEDLRQAETPLNRQDPKYRPGVGGRIGNAILNLFSGGIPGVVRGAIDPSAPAYFGKGATNSQYTRDRMAQNQRIAADEAKNKSFEGEYNEAEKGFNNATKSYNDETRRAYEADKNDINQQRDKERKDYQDQIADIKQQLADAKDPETKIRAEQRARSAIAKEVGLKPGYATNSYILTGKYPDDEAISRRLDLMEERLGIARDRAQHANAKDQTAQRTKAETEKEAELFRLESQFKKDWDKASSNLKGDELTQRQKELTDRMNQDKARVQGAYEQKLAQIPGEQQPPERVTGKPSPKAAQPTIPQPIAPVRTGQQKPSPNTKPAHKVDDIVTVKGQKMRITRILPNGKYEGVPAR